MSRDLAVLVPVLNRPRNVRPLVDSISAATPGARVLFLCDPHDRAEQEAVGEVRSAYPLKVDSVMPGGNYAAKMNEGVRLTEEPLIFLGADDIRFHRGWLEAAAAKMGDTVGVVGTNDLCNPRTATGELSTHTLVARWYADLGTIDDPARLLHEAYPHEYVDQELVETARHRGMYAHAPDSVVEHLHPDAGKAPIDELYAARPARMRRGLRVFRRRRHLWT